MSNRFKHANIDSIHQVSILRIVTVFGAIEPEPDYQKKQGDKKKK
jgi:hypothetical protein